MLLNLQKQLKSRVLGCTQNQKPQTTKIHRITKRSIKDKGDEQEL